MPSPDLSDYVTVAQRIAQFRTAHPTGSLRPADPAKPYDMLKIGDFTMLVVVAAAYRTPDDDNRGRLADDGARRRRTALGDAHLYAAVPNRHIESGYQRNGPEGPSRGRRD